MSFDEEALDLHGECRHEIERLTAALRERDAEIALLKAAHGKSARARRRIRRVNKFDGDKAAIALARKYEGAKAEITEQAHRIAQLEVDLYGPGNEDSDPDYRDDPAALEGLTTSEAEFMAKLREYENSDTWLLFVNYGFSMETARSLYDKGLIDTSKQMGMPAARLKRPMTAEEAAHECIEFSRTFGGLEKEEFRLNIARLRSLGYVVIPVTPSGEAVERMAAAYAREDGAAVEFKDEPPDYQGYARQEVRRLYAAIVGGEG